MLDDRIFRELTIIEKLGSGGYGTVYKCRDKSGNLMALKIIDQKHYGIPSLLEPVIMATLRHPTLNPAINITTNSTQLLILQLLAQQDLRQWRRKHVPTEDQLCKWSFDLIQAIHILHQCGLIHGDIKSPNILVFDEITVRLSDFSLISLAAAEKTSNKVFGTANYRAPEIWRGIPWDQSIDIWGLGCVLFELCHGKSLFDFSAIFSSITNESPQVKRQMAIDKISNILRYPPTEYLSSYFKNHPIGMIINRCLSFSSSERPTTWDLLNDPYFNSLIPHPSITILSASIKNEKVAHSRTTQRVIQPSHKSSTSVSLSLPRDFPTEILSVFTSIECVNLLNQIHGLLQNLDKPNLNHRSEDSRRARSSNTIGEPKIISSDVICVWLTAKLLNFHQIINHSWFKSQMSNILPLEREVCDQLKYRLIGSYLKQIKKFD